MQARSKHNKSVNNFEYVQAPNQIWSSSPPSHRGIVSLTPSTTVNNQQTNVTPIEGLELMLLHEKFPELVNLATEIKEIRSKISSQSEQTCRNESDFDDVFDSVNRIQQALITRNQPSEKIRVGQYPQIDDRIHHSMLVLIQERDAVLKWLNQQPVRISPSMDSSDTRNRKTSPKEGKGSKDKKEAIAIKYPKAITDVLMNWMIENKDHPFPDQKAIDDLMKQTGLDQSQIVNWTTNVRKRNIKATCEGGKKPHHFIDFLFLAHERDKIRNSSKTAMKPADITSVPIALTLAYQQKHKLQPQHVMRMRGGYKQPSIPSKKRSLTPKESLKARIENANPLCMNEELDRQLLKEFADGWLLSNPASGDYFNDLLELDCPTTDDLLDDNLSLSADISDLLQSDPESQLLLTSNENGTSHEDMIKAIADNLFDINTREAVQDKEEDSDFEDFIALDFANIEADMDQWAAELGI